MGTKSDTDGNRNLIRKDGPHWSQHLMKAVTDPKKIVLEDELTTVIKDLYPKATYHYLVCPKEHIPTLKSVEMKHLDLLKHMHKVGQKISRQHKDKNFLLGYHAIPSMLLLHLHVISDDFDSPYLKTKKHWNSFTTNYFISSEKLIQQFEEKGVMSVRSLSEYKNCIQQNLACHKCEYKPNNMPDLKTHLKIHL
ncbi:hypothetical protein RUM44_008377 [Polyplax serrata]|uniref:HIT domain-containing protein n=1 Tax=Polyplax serrata TaxID=468196 RepID=A0ABR1BC32_POLSC